MKKSAIILALFVSSFIILMANLSWTVAAVISGLGAFFGIEWMRRYPTDDIPFTSRNIFLVFGVPPILLIVPAIVTYALGGNFLAILAGVGMAAGLQQYLHVRRSDKKREEARLLRH